MNTEVKRIWVLSPQKDGLFLIASGFLGLLLGLVSPLLGVMALWISFFVYFALGLTHFGSTFFFYMDETNRQYFHTKPWVFYYVPVLLILAPIALVATPFGPLVIIITYWFSGWHVMKQSVGITALYRGKLGIFGAIDREIDTLAIMSASFLALFGRLLRFEDFGYERFFVQYYGDIIFYIILAFFCYALVRWVKLTRERFKAHGNDAWPLFLFTLVSILLFTPFLYVENFQVAFMANLLGHYSQYIVLVWIINHNKYALEGKGPSPKPPVLTYLSKHLYLYAGVLLAYALAVTLVGQISVLLPVVGLTWAHFYVDGFLFKFKDPEVRKLILPYIS